MNLKSLPFLPLCALLLCGCFAHKEAPERHLAAASVEEALEYAQKGMGVELMNLSSQGLSSVPDLGFCKESLKILYLSENKLSGLAHLKGLDRLEVLDLGFSGLESFPAEIGSLPALRDLYLGGNALASLPPLPAGAAHLRYLNLDRNRISEIPSSFPPSLRWLRLNGNRLSSLPERLEGLEGLERIYLADNRLESIPEAIGKSKRLTDVNLRGNRLKEFPKVLLGLPNLRNLDISGNREITSLPEDSELAKMTSLRMLNLGGLGLDARERDRIRKVLGKSCTVIVF